MNADPNTLRLVRTTVIIVGIVVVMSVAAEVLKPLALAILLAFILAPLVQWGEHSGLPRPISVAVVLALVFAIVGGTGYVVGDQFASLAEKVPTYQANLQKKIAALRPQSNSTFEKLGRAVSSFEQSVRPREADYATPVRVVSDNAKIAQLQSLMGPFHLTLAFGGVVLLLLVFLLIESNDISDRIVQMVGWGKNRSHYQDDDPDRSGSKPLLGHTGAVQYRLRRGDRTRTVGHRPALSSSLGLARGDPSVCSLPWNGHIVLAPGDHRNFSFPRLDPTAPGDRPLRRGRAHRQQHRTLDLRKEHRDLASRASGHSASSGPGSGEAWVSC